MKGFTKPFITLCTAVLLIAVWTTEVGNLNSPNFNAELLLDIVLTTVLISAVVFAWRNVE